MKIDSLSNVGVFVRDHKKAKEFYTKKLGLKVRSSIPKWQYLEVGATKGGEDASLNLWKPTREMWGDAYDEAKKSIGVVTGIGFLTTNIEATIAPLRRKNVKVEGPGPAGRAQIASVYDPDGNSLFVLEPPKPKVRRQGLLALQWVTVASRDAARTGEFFTKALGMKGGVSDDEGMHFYSLSRRGTALMPFTPNKEMYDDPKDYEDDLSHIGENTSVMFTTKNIHRLQDELLARGVRFSQKAEKAAWGGIEAEFLDPDGNRYALIQGMS
jgi:catechol 2,3-dioxygenase-like lactoylglutathione lyase family enzyme